MKLDFIRGLVRPLLVLSGWLAVLAVFVILVLKFATVDMLTVMVGFITGSLATMVGFYFQERTKPPTSSTPPAPPTPPTTIGTR